MGEESEEYTCSHLLVRVTGSYLDEGELIAAVLHGERDAYYFYCGCHYADVVYTTRNRLVCMACGAMHAVLRRPLAIAPKVVLADDEWADLFDEDGSRRDEEIELGILDFQDVEPAETIWTTEQWEDAKHEFIFFARSSPEEIADAIRGTERDQAIFLEAGWTPVDLPPPSAHQVATNSVRVDLLTNAALALEEGVAAYVRARNDPDRLVTAVLQLFRAVELVLKAKLEDADSEGLKDQPNNPVVLDRLAAGGVALLPDELATVTQTRRLRNKLQHGTAQLNYRNGLNTCRNTVAFLDRFVEEELGIWIADTINADDWWQLLTIPSVAARASKVAGQRIEDMRNSPNVQIASCPRCKQFALVRPHPATGHACVYCKYVPVH